MNILKVKAHVRYCEDGIVNGHDDISYEEQRNGVEPKMPCMVSTGKGEWVWCPEINVDDGIILNWKKGTIASVHYKVCDECELEYVIDSVKLCDNDGYYYVPQCLSPKENGYGDYIIMDITDDGHIVDWNFTEFCKWTDVQTAHIRESLKKDGCLFQELENLKHMFYEHIINNKFVDGDYVELRMKTSFTEYGEPVHSYYIDVNSKSVSDYDNLPDALSHFLGF